MKATIQYIRKELSTIYQANEIEGLVKIIFRHLKGYTLTDITLRRDEVLTESEIRKVKLLTDSETKNRFSIFWDMQSLQDWY